MMKIDELKNTCELLGLKYSILEEDLAVEYIDKALKKFKPGKTSGHLAIQSELSLKLKTDEHEFTFSQSLCDEPVYLFFDQRKKERQYVFVLEKGQKLNSVLNECYGMEYFVSDEKVSFLISVNWYVIEIIGDVSKSFPVS